MSGDYVRAAEAEFVRRLAETAGVGPSKEPAAEAQATCQRLGHRNGPELQGFERLALVLRGIGPAIVVTHDHCQCPSPIGRVLEPVVQAAIRQKPDLTLFVPGWLRVIYATGTGGHTYANVFVDLVLDL